MTGHWPSSWPRPEQLTRSIRYFTHTVRRFPSRTQIGHPVSPAAAAAARGSRRTFSGGCGSPFFNRRTCIRPASRSI
jgi:hypothetical protein